MLFFLNLNKRNPNKKIIQHDAVVCGIRGGQTWEQNAIISSIFPQFIQIEI